MRKILLLLTLLCAPATAQTVPFTSSSMMFMKPAATAQSTNAIMNKVVNYTCTTNYYVDGLNGNNSNAGTAPGSGHAWATIAKATSGNTVFNAGVCVNVAPTATYNENVILAKSGGGAGSNNSVSGYAVLRCSTTASPFTGVRPVCVINGQQSGGGTAALDFTASYAILDGFEVTNATTGVDVNCVHSGSQTSGPNHLGIYNSYVHGCGGGGIGFNSGEYFYIQGNEVAGNACCSLSYDSGISLFQLASTGSESGTLDAALKNFTTPAGTVHIHNVISNNLSYNNVENNPNNDNKDSDGEGIILDCNQGAACPRTAGSVNYPYGFLLYGNILYGNGSNGIEVGQSYNAWVVNNTAYGNNTDIHGCYNTNGACTNVGGTNGDYNKAELWGTCGGRYTFQNNIGVAVPGTVAPVNQAYAGGSTGGCGSNTLTQNDTWANNIFNMAGSNVSLNSTVNVWFCCTSNQDTIPSSGPGANKINVDPKFTNPGSHNFTLQSTSPGLNAGTSALSGLGIATPNIGAL